MGAPDRCAAAEDRRDRARCAQTFTLVVADLVFDTAHRAPRVLEVMLHNAGNLKGPRPPLPNVNALDPVTRAETSTAEKNCLRLAAARFLRPSIARELQARVEDSDPMLADAVSEHAFAPELGMVCPFCTNPAELAPYVTRAVLADTARFAQRVASAVVILQDAGVLIRSPPNFQMPWWRKG